MYDKRNKNKIFKQKNQFIQSTLRDELVFLIQSYKFNGQSIISFLEKHFSPTTAKKIFRVVGFKIIIAWVLYIFIIFVALLKITGII